MSGLKPQIDVFTPFCQASTMETSLILFKHIGTWFPAKRERSKWLSVIAMIFKHDYRKGIAPPFRTSFDVAEVAVALDMIRDVVYQMCRFESHQG